MKYPVTFRLALVDTVFSVGCLFESTKHHCEDFLVEDSAAASCEIAITMADIDRERAYLLSKKARDEQLEASTPEALEVLVLLRRVAERLPRHDAVLFHGSALALDGEGVLFTATSGTGKSTHARLWCSVYGDRVTMVNDDKPFLRFEGETVRVCGTPWQGKHRLGRNLSVPLKAVCIVCRGGENRMERITAKEALPLLLQQTYRPEQPEGVMQTLRLVEMLSRQTALYRLHCNMESDAARTAFEAIGFREKEN